MLVCNFMVGELVIRVLYANTLREVHIHPAGTIQAPLWESSLS